MPLWLTTITITTTTIATITTTITITTITTTTIIIIDWIGGSLGAITVVAELGLCRYLAPFFYPTKITHATISMAMKPAVQTSVLRTG